MKKILLLLQVILYTIAANAQKDPIERVWWNEEKTSKIQLHKAADGKFYGKIIFLQQPNDANGKPKLDNKNPDDKLKNTPVLNLVILQNFTKSKELNIYEGGTVYDPNSGKTYCGKLTLNGKELKLRGYICSFSLLGRSSVWTAAD